MYCSRIIIYYFPDCSYGFDRELEMCDFQEITSVSSIANTSLKPSFLMCDSDSVHIQEALNSDLNVIIINKESMASVDSFKPILYFKYPLKASTLKSALKSIYSCNQISLENSDESSELKSTIKKQQREIEESVALLQSYKNAVDASTILSKTTPNGVITYANSEFCRISGYSRDELVGKPHNILRHPDMPKSVFENMWKQLLDKKIWKGLVKNRTKSGGSYWVDATIVPILDQNKEIVEFVALRHDITDLKNYEISLESMVDEKSKKLNKNIKLLEEYKNAVDESSILSKTDKSGKITYVNDEFCRISGFDRDELVGKPHSIVRHPDMPKEAFKDMWSTILDKNIWRGIVKNLKKDGNSYWVKATIVPIVDNFGDIVEFVGVRQDITELIEYRESLEKKVTEEVEKNRQKDILLQQRSAQASIGEMVNSIAHQWRQPINAISLEATNININVELLRYEDIITSANHITKLTQTMSQTIDDFMEISNPEREKSSFAIKDVVDSIKKLLQSQLYAKNIEFVNLINENLEIYTYKNDIKQILINIINNAKDAFIGSSEDKKTITIGALEKDKRLLIFIEDNAGGVLDDIFNKIFDPYVSTKEYQKGSGLGLYISKKIAQEQLDGEIVCRNTKDGAVFEIIIPYNNKKERV